MREALSNAANPTCSSKALIFPKYVTLPTNHPKFFFVQKCVHKEVSLKAFTFSTFLPLFFCAQRKYYICSIIINTTNRK